jgi:hypothetical protein
MHLTMGQFILIVLVGWIVFVFLQLRRLTHICFMHVKDQIRAELEAGQEVFRSNARSARRRGETVGLHQPTMVSLANPARYVRLLPGPLFPLMPIRQQIRGVWIWWTPLVLYPTEKWLDELRVSVAHFFGVQPEELHRDHFNIRRRRVWFGRATG